MSTVYSASPTPFKNDLSIDTASLARLLENNIRDGVQGFFLAGNMGEWSQLSLADREELTECAVTVAAGRAEILAGCTANSLRETAANMKTLARYNPDAFVMMNPLPTTSQYPRSIICWLCWICPTGRSITTIVRPSHMSTSVSTTSDDC